MGRCRVAPRATRSPSPGSPSATAGSPPVRSYSLGMRQRLGLAGALLGDPQLLLLDEPANGLDPAGVRWLRTVLRAFAEAGGTVLVSSHLLAELLKQRTTRTTAGMAAAMLGLVVAAIALHGLGLPVLKLSGRSQQLGV